MIRLTQKEIKDILSIVERANISIDTHINEDNFEHIFDRCWGNGVWNFDAGVSKGVLFLNDYPDIVVKIPFSEGGEASYRSYYTNEDGNTCCTYNLFNESFTSAGQSLPPRLEDKLVRNWDYCEVETILFEDACRAGVDSFFAETVLIGYCNGYPVYVQEKARIYEGESEYGYEQEYDSKGLQQLWAEIKKEVEECLQLNEFDYLWFGIAKEWLIDFYLYYGAEALGSFWEYLEDTCIDDLHCSNIGYINHRPVVTDYASFNS